jgi:hypothetical protein
LGGFVEQAVESVTNGSFPQLKGDILRRVVAAIEGPIGQASFAGDLGE